MIKKSVFAGIALLSVSTISFAYPDLQVFIQNQTDLTLLGNTNGTVVFKQGVNLPPHSQLLLYYADFPLGGGEVGFSSNDPNHPFNCWMEYNPLKDRAFQWTHGNSYKQLYTCTATLQQGTTNVMSMIIQPVK